MWWNQSYLNLLNVNLALSNLPYNVLRGFRGMWKERGMIMIEKDSRKMIEIIIRRYPEKKKEYEEYISDIMAASSGESAVCLEEYCRPQSVTEAKSMKINGAYAERLKKQIDAVEFVYNGLSEEEQRLMRGRFWKDRRRNVPYLKIKGVSYSERQMRRIVYRIILQVGKYIGEIR